MGDIDIPLGWSGGGGSSSTNNAQAVAAAEQVLDRTMPWLSSNAALSTSLAMSGIDPVDLAQNGVAALNITNASDFAYTLTQQSPSQQRAVYDDLTIDQIQTLKDVGYMGPPEDVVYEAPTIDQKIVGYAAQGVSAVFDNIPLRSQIGWVGKEALERMFFVGDQPAHFYRTIRGMDETSQAIAGAGAIAAVALSRGRIRPNQAIGTFRALGRVGLPAITGATAAGFASNPSRWIEAWNDSNDGERFFDRGALNEVKQALNNNPEYVRLAKDIATDLTPDELATEIAGVRDALSGGEVNLQKAESRLNDIAAQYADKGTPEHQEIVKALGVLLSQPEFMQQVVKLAQNKISPGRDIARLASHIPGFEIGSTGYNVISGAVDATWLISLDPFLAAAPVVRSMRMMRYAAFPTKVRAGAEINMGKGVFLDNMVHLHNKKGKMYRMNMQIIQAANKNSYAMMPANMRRLFNPLRTWAEQKGLYTNGKWVTREIDGEQVTGLVEDDLFEFYATQEALGLFMGGAGLRAGVAERIFQPIPETSALGRLRRELLEFRGAINEPYRNRELRKLAEKNGVDLDEVYKIGMEDLGPNGQVVKLEPVAPKRLSLTEAGGVGQALGKTFSFVPFIPVAGKTIGKLIGTTSKMQSRGAINLRTGEGVSEFVNTVGEIFNLPEWFVAGYVDNVMRQTNEAAKLQVIRSFYESIFDLTGLREVGAGREIYEKYVKRIYESYSIGGLDTATVNSRGLQRGRGLMPGQIVDSIAVPNGEEMLKAKRAARFADEVLQLENAREVIDVSTNKFWKPAVLFSVKYIVRSVGEEILTAFARGTQGSWGNDVATRVRAKFDDFVRVQTKVRNSPVGVGSLSQQEQAIYKWGTDTIMGKRITNMFQSSGANLDQLTFENYRSWLYRLFDQGVAGRFESLNRLSDMGMLRQSMLLGRKNSWRRTLLNGTEKQTYMSARTWNRLGARSVMDKVSSGSQGLNAEQVVPANNLPRFYTDDALPTPVFYDPSNYQTYTPEDEFFEFAVIHENQQLFNNEIIGQQILQPYFLRLIPEEVDVQELGQLLSMVDGIENPMYQDIFLMLAFGKDDQLEAFGQQLKFIVQRGDDGEFLRPDLVDSLLPTNLTPDDIDNFADGLITFAKSEFKTQDTWSSQVRAAAIVNPSLQRFLTTANKYVPMLRSLDETGTKFNYLLAALKTHARGARYGKSPFAGDVVNAMAGGAYDSANVGKSKRIYTVQDDWEDDLYFDLFNEALTGESREYVRDSEFMLRSAGEATVLEQMPARGSVAVFSPDIVDLSRTNGFFQQAINRGLTDTDPTFFDEVADAVLATTEARTAASGLLTPDTYDDLRQYLVATLKSIYYRYSDPATGIISRGPRKFGVSPSDLEGFSGRLVFDNPQVAIWINDVLDQTSDSVMIRQLLQEEATRPVSPYLLTDETPTQLPSSISREQSGSMGNVYLLDPEEQAQLVTTRKPRRTNMYAEAVDDFVNQQVEHIKAVTFTGSGETITARDGVFQLDQQGNPQLVPAGTSVLPGNDFVDATGNIIVTQDRSYFIKTLNEQTNNAPMWNVIGPLIADSADVRGGAQIVKYKRLKNSDEGEYVILTHSRATDVTDVPVQMRPEVATAPRAGLDLNTVKTNILRQGVSKFFEFNAHAVDAVRTPLAFHFFNQRLQQNYNFVADFIGTADDVEGFAKPALDELLRGLRTVNSVDNAGTTLNNVITTDAIDTFGDNAAATYMWLDELFADVPTEVVDKLRRGETTTEEFLRFASESQPAASPAIEETINGIAFGLLPPSQKVDEEALGVVFLIDDADELPEFLSVVKDIDGRALGQELLAIRNFKEIAAERAALATINDIIPFIDSHEYKSVFSLYVKNLLPFWYAEENFLKRWVRGAINNGTYGLEELRRAQLTFMGGRSSGIIQEDANGEQWVVYPGSGLWNNAFGRIFGDFGSPNPTNYVFASRLDGLLPGFNDQAGRPGVGPWSAFPLTMLAMAYPEVQGLRRTIVGDVGATKGLIEQATQFVLPTFFARFANLLNNDENTNLQLGNAMRQAMQIRAARGDIPSEGATAKESQDWYDEVKQDARGLLISNYIYGFFAPGVPYAMPVEEGLGNLGFWSGLDITNPRDLLSPVYRRFMYTYGPEEGLEKFAEYAGSIAPDSILNPEMFGVSQSRTASGAPLAVTQEAVDFYSDHEDDAVEFPYAFGWMTPTPTLDDEFDSYAWFEQMNHELKLRERATPEEYYDSLFFRRAAPPYFAMKDRHERELMEFTGTDEEKRLLEVRQRNQVEEYLTLNPYFKYQLRDTSSMERRERTLGEMRVFFNDPEKQEIYGGDERFFAYQYMVNWYDWWYANRAAYPGNSKRALENRAVVDAQMADFVGRWLLQYPNMRGFYTMIIGPQLNETVENAVEQIGSAQ
jgi:hypothetical protein